MLLLQLADGLFELVELVVEWCGGDGRVLQPLPPMAHRFEYLPQREIAHGRWSRDEVAVGNQASARGWAHPIGDEAEAIVARKALQHVPPKLG